MDDKPDVGQGTGAPSSPDGGLRRDRRRLRESARAEVGETVSREQSTPPTVGPDTGGFSAFEALGFERRSFEPSAHEPAPVDTSRFRDIPAPASPAAAEPLTPPQYSGVTPPAYGSEPARPFAQSQPSAPIAAQSTTAPPTTPQPDASATPPLQPPPLEEPPRPAVPPVTHAFASHGPFSQPTKSTHPQDAPHADPSAGADPGTGLPDAAAYGLRPAAFTVPPRPDAETPTRAPSAAELYSPPAVAAPVVSPTPPTAAPATSPFGGAPVPPGSPSRPEANPSVALSAPIVPAVAPSHDLAPIPSAGDTPRPTTATASPPGHPVLGPLAPRAHETPQEVDLLDRIALAASIVLPPVGFVLGLVASARGRAYRGWSSAIARASLWVAVGMTFVFIVAGVFLWSEQQKQLADEESAQAAAAAHAALVEESAAFCGALAGSPVLATDAADFGWPAADDPAGYVPAISAYAASWQGLVPLAPAVIAEQVTSASAQIDQIVASAANLPEPHRAGDLLDLQAVAEIEAVQAHVTEYCAPANTGE